MKTKGSTTRSKSIQLLLSLAAMVLISPSLQAAVFVINATDRGWYDTAGFHDPINDNYIAGNSSTVRTVRNFFVFDLPNTSDAILSAELRLLNPFDGFTSPSPSETYELYDVSTSIVNLIAGGTGLTLTYLDLGAGTAYGNTVATAATNGTTISIALNASFIAAAQSVNGGLIALGGAVTTLDANSSTVERVFGFTGGNLASTQLVITTIPEPTSFGLVCLGIGSLLVRRMRRQVG